MYYVLCTQHKISIYPVQFPNIIDLSTKVTWVNKRITNIFYFPMLYFMPIIIIMDSWITGGRQDFLNNIYSNINRVYNYHFQKKDNIYDLYYQLSGPY